MSYRAHKIFRYRRIEPQMETTNLLLHIYNIYVCVMISYKNDKNCFRERVKRRNTVKHDFVAVFSFCFRCKSFI